jgi:hypothetical protein
VESKFVYPITPDEGALLLADYLAYPIGTLQNVKVVGEGHASVQIVKYPGTVRPMISKVLSVEVKYRSHKVLEETPDYVRLRISGHYRSQGSWRQVVRAEVTVKIPDLIALRKALSRI